MLLLKAKATGIERTINEGSRISIICNDHRKLKGKLKIISNSAIMLGANKINIDEINSINRGTVFSKVTSSILIAGGGFLIAYTYVGLSTTINKTKEYKVNLDPVPGYGLIGIGAGLLTAGIIYFINGKKYKKELWEYSVITK
jgi:hypothetical protein